MNRKEFLQKTSLLSAGMLLGANSIWAKKYDFEQNSLTIFHTNDVHSRLEPFPTDDAKYAGKGGVAQRKTLIDKLRAENNNSILVDCGDIFQGTPYFNQFKGEPEIKAMSLMGYDCATMGNHDFDAGLENFATQLLHANFPFVVSNYNFDNTILKDKIKKYHILQKGKNKIGIIGLGIELNGLVPENLYGNTIYENPVEKANYYAEYLKNTEKCDYVICLSHLGYSYENSNKICDLTLTPQTKFIDVILGGHTHTFLEKPTITKNKKGKNIIINQAGWGGLQLGQIDLGFTLDKKQLTNTKNHWIEDLA